MSEMTPSVQPPSRNQATATRKVRKAPTEKAVQTPRTPMPRPTSTVVAVPGTGTVAKASTMATGTRKTHRERNDSTI
ncbi:MAG: hypothetical protein BRD51_06190, partial [Bacteroidetes bacterium SW_11_64_17]